MPDLIQPGILEGIPSLARYLTLGLLPGTTGRQVREALDQIQVDGSCVLGLGPALVELFGGELEGLRSFEPIVGATASMPGTGGDLWIWLRGSDRGDLLLEGRRLTGLLGGLFEVLSVADGFRFRGGLDLSGYEDGTENPEGEDALRVGFGMGRGPGLDGGSFVAVQRWVHDLGCFDGLPGAEQDGIIGRRRSDNEELGDAPESAHVKRTAQEDFEPEAFVLRRSMPWANETEEGLMFVSFGTSFDAFEALSRRMVGLDDGIVDALFRFTQPVSGSYFFCPPLVDGRLDLRALAPGI